MRQPHQDIRFLLDGEVHTPPPLPPTTTVLQYLRDTLGRCGTKEGCAEGDCGACTVVVGEAQDGHIRYRPINSCIRFLPTLDGKSLVTSESLAAPDGTLHPVQQAMVDQHASQCGFCTPGFVMSLFALYQRQHTVNADEVVDALSGNLCRCTGYRPIIDAGCRMNRYPAQHWSREAAQAPEQLSALQALARHDALDLPGFYAPRSVAELAARLLLQPDALILSGATDIGLWVTKQLRELPPMIYLGEVAELRAVRHTADGLEIGAAVALADAWPPIVAQYPALAELARRFASAPVCNSGTLCGNIANGSPIGDSMPALIALGASLTLRRGDATRQLPLERFYLGYQKKDLQPGEFVESVRLPPLAPNTRLACYKVSKRFDQDISAVCAAIACTVVDGTIVGARLGYGGVAATPARAAATEAALTGADWSAASFERAAAALAQDFTPLTDMRGSGGYRLRVAGNLLKRYFLDMQGGVATRITAALDSPGSPP